MNKSSGFKVEAIIPAYNEEASIGRVLDDLSRLGLDRILVVDNNSADRTAEVAGKHGAEVVFEPKRGYGQACWRGILALSPDTDVVLFLDADYSDYPEEAVHLLQPIYEEKADLVIGSRILGNAEPSALLPQARFGNWLAGVLINLLYGYRYTDLGPFRAIRRESLDKIGMQDRGFGWTVEMQVKALKTGLKVREVPVSYRPRIGKSKISGTFRGSVRAGHMILYTIFKYFFAD
ncbi:MAG: glycosyltransferase family 2 protein [bacterium]